MDRTVSIKARFVDSDTSESEEETHEDDDNDDDDYEEVYTVIIRKIHRNGLLHLMKQLK